MRWRPLTVLFPLHFRRMNSSHTGSSSAPPSSALAQQLEQGYDFLRDGRLADAIQLSRALIDAHPSNSHAFVFAAEASLANDDPEGALTLIDQAISHSHGDPFLKIKKARLLPQLRRRDEIPAIAAEVASQADGNSRLLWQLGKLYYRNNLQADAIVQFEKAHALLGNHPGLLYDMAVARFFSGDFERAERDLDRVLAVAPQSGPALYLRATLRRQTPQRNHTEDIARRLRNGFRKPTDEAAALYALAKELEDLGEYDKSFDALQAGAARMRGTLSHYDVAAECASLQAIQDAYTSTTMAAPIEGYDKEGAIFIVGMPRTGTTLAERLLVQSGVVTAAGELLDFGNLLAAATRKLFAAEPAQTTAEASLKIDFATLGRDYMRGVRQVVDGSPFFIDKMPVNYLYCGMIHKALPKAKIIHVVRDPLDTCYAVFKTLFFDSYSFSYDQEELAEYYIAYHRMMRHWHEVMPGQILDVRYENLVTDTEYQAKRIFDWCGLEWSPAVLETPDDKAVFATASAAQVREPVHSRSVNSSRRHLERLAPLVAKLKSAGIIES